MAVKTFGKIYFKEEKNKWVLDKLEPHVSMRLKQVFTFINKTKTFPFYVDNTPLLCADLSWFLLRYPLEISETDAALLHQNENKHKQTLNDMEAIFMPDYHPHQIVIKEPYEARPYQLKAAELHKIQKRFLLGDDIGLGKTLTSILTLLQKETLPAAVVVQAHLPKQWKEEQIEKFTNLKVHIITKSSNYNLPPADVYIFKYTSLSGWVETFKSGYFKSAIFDEIQEVRRAQSSKHQSCRVLSQNVEYVMGLSATPIYNYGDEMYHVMNIIDDKVLGTFDEFQREWCTYKGGKTVVMDPAALGSYLREQHVFLRRTRKEVGRELPPLNKVVHTIEHDAHEAAKSYDIARDLAIKVTTSSSFVERGVAARDLDIYMRLVTGVSKAKFVAAYCRIFLENNIPILVAGWHRQVYEIWQKELAEFNPVLYTGTESIAQKHESKRKFIEGETNCMFISLRSGIGLDGLQHRCRDVIYGELDWSPMVHEQLAGRLRRDGNEEQVTAYYPVSEFGSDPVMIGMLGLKSSQSEGIINPFETSAVVQLSDESRIQLLAQDILKKHKH